MELDHIIPPPTSFYFNVHFMGPLAIMDMAFLEVSGLSMQLSTYTVASGGEGESKLPTTPKHSYFVCKRPMKPIAMSALSVWTAVSMYGGVDVPIIPCDVMVTLLSPIGTPECGWFIKGAYPVKWDVAPFDSKKNDIAIETIEFEYKFITRIM